MMWRAAAFARLRGHDLLDYGVTADRRGHARCPHRLRCLKTRAALRAYNMLALWSIPALRSMLLGWLFDGADVFFALMGAAASVSAIV
jgi:hypothetical protein